MLPLNSGFHFFTLTKKKKVIFHFMFHNFTFIGVDNKKYVVLTPSLFALYVFSRLLTIN